MNWNSIMAMFVHLAPESSIPLIRRNGIRRTRKTVGSITGGVYAVPVTRNFYASHQWLRELKRLHPGSLAGIYFRIPDDDQVWVGHYQQHHEWMTAAEAVGTFTEAEDAQGWEILIPRRIEAAEVHRVRSLPQVIGWRFSPTSKGKKPFCNCKFCNRGDYGFSKRLKRLGIPKE